ncbi:MAG: hypothetical protein ABSB84_02445 [Verrucomicrobiota bacterium]
MRLARAHYDLHGMRMTVEAQSQSLLDVIETMLGAYASIADGADGFHVTLDYGQPRQEIHPGLRDFWTGTLPGGTRMICRSGPNRRQIEMPDHVQADIDLAGRIARIVVSPGSKAGLLETCFLPLLCDCLGLAGHHVIHAASLFFQIGGQRRALIFSGMSGRGKTTLALALAGAGLGMLADDMTFYQAATTNQPGQIWGIRIHCKVHSRTLELLPWLRDLPMGSATLHGERLLDPRPLEPQTTGMTASPGLILFLNPRNTEAHRIEPVDKVTALTRLTRENVRALDRRREAAAGRAFEALAELVRSSRTFQVSLCPRLEELPDRLASLWS